METATAAQTAKATQPFIIQSAFLLDNGLRIMIYTSQTTGISSHHCDENFKPVKEFAKCPKEWMDKSCVEYHRTTQETHKGLGSELIKEHSTEILQEWK